MQRREGKVLLAGAGPGAADLLTVRALRAIESADIVLYDALVGEEVIALIPVNVKRVAVGKRGHRPSTPQDFINRLMARYAKRGASVVRLKGGDPSMFGRAAEERAFLEAQGVRVEVIAGVTAASAAAAQFSFSLTERGVARRVMLATGRTLDGVSADWRAACDAKTTLCLYMGCADMAEIALRLIAGGRDPATPVMVMSDVERPGAQVLRVNLAALTNGLAGASAPTLIVIGAVARERLSCGAEESQVRQAIA